MQIALLGPVEVRVDDARVAAPSGGRPRALLAMLALQPGAVVPQATLRDGLWGERAPGANALHTVVSRLRRSLAELGDRAADGVESHPSGYRLDVRPDDVDAVRAERLASEARARLADGDTVAAGRLAEGALRLWRGEPLADVDAAPFTAAAVARLDELRLDLRDLATAAALGGGDPVDIAELEARARANPLREHLQGLLVRALYAAGRQADALQTYDRTRRALADELGVDPSPDLERIHLAVLRQDDTVAPAARCQRRSNLRAQLTSFVGRDADVGHLAEMLRTHRLVTLVGTGGAGKTRLADEVAGRLADKLRDGAWFIELAPVHDPDDLPLAVLSALGMRDQVLLDSTRMDYKPPPPADVTERLVGHLSGSELLLVLDNCEHLVGATARLADTVLAACRRVRVLATSREPLGITGETLAPVTPLAYPPDGVPAEEMASYAAMELFRDRASAVRPDFTLDAGNAGDVAEICRRLDGLPLAIELAAARIQALSATQIAARLSDRFRLLTGGSRTAVPRHQTLLAVVDWSWDLLEKPERLLLQRMAVFAGAVTLEDIEQICSDDELPRDGVLDVLATLVQKSLVDTVGDATVRYRLLETIRAYAGERLAESGTAEELRERHARHLLVVVREAEPRLRGPDQLDWLTRVDDLREDVVAALRWSIEAGHANLAVGLVAYAGWYWMLRGMHAELRYWPQRAADVAGDSDPLAYFLTTAFAAVASGRDLEATKERFDALLALSETVPDPHAHPFLAMFPVMRLFLGNGKQDMRGELRELEETATGHPDRWTRAMARFLAGHMLDNIGEPDAALAAFEQSYAEFAALGERWGQSMTLSMLADFHGRRHEYTRAIEEYQAAEDRLRALSTRDDIAMMRLRIASVYARKGDADAARRCLADLDGVAERVGVPELRVFIQSVEAEIAYSGGEPESAYALLANAMDTCQDVTGPEHAQVRTTVTVPLAFMAIRTGRIDEAGRRLSEAAATPSPVPDMPRETTLIEEWADWATAIGAATDAARLLGAAEAMRGSPYSHHPRHDKVVQVTRAALGDEAYDRAYAEGTSRSRDDAQAWVNAWIAAHSGVASEDATG